MLLRIVTACNRAYFPGLCLTLSSAIVNLPRTISPCITVIHEGLCWKHKKKLEKLLTKYNSHTEVDFYTASEGLPHAPGLHPLAYARLLAPDIVPDEVFVYLDSDLLVLRNVADLLGHLSCGAVVAAPVCGILGDDCPWLEASRMNPEDLYFCSGVMAVNKRRWIEKNLTESGISLAKRDFEKCTNYDQTILNFVLHGMVNFVDETWSWNHWRFDEIHDGPIILHYITRGKPWRVPLGYGARGLWLKAYKKLCSSVFPIRWMLLLLASKVYELEKVMHGAITSGVFGKLIRWIAPQKCSEWDWSWKRAREAQGPEARKIVRNAISRLDEQIVVNRRFSTKLSPDV